ncbi:hypothetical protein Naga_100075g26 [Nannochloropsis gaditana]|uniref:Uncharacterized protein n=1 Tax=Nannochloropsis gaditana TaxID=72520 RepID=W7TLJ9_9STRA|nr:hypothetical protein Naga_100075g26 [Nannochloropsis gaditana]
MAQVSPACHRSSPCNFCQSCFATKLFQGSSFRHRRDTITSQHENEDYLHRFGALCNRPGLQSHFLRHTLNKTYT